MHILAVFDAEYCFSRNTISEGVQHQEVVWSYVVEMLLDLVFFGFRFFVSGFLCLSLRNFVDEIEEQKQLQVEAL